MTDRLRFAVITTHNRPEDYQDCWEAILPQVDVVITVSHRAPYADNWTLNILYDEDVPNISQMWNLGLDNARDLAAGEPYYVAVLNDDAIVPEGWFDKITEAMRRHSCIIGSADQYGRPHTVAYRKAMPIDLRDRMAGFAYILDGDSGLRLDEQFQWWYGDDDLDWTARERGGVVRVEDCEVEHRYPNQSTVGELALIAWEDRIRFINKWGRAPH